MVTSGGRLLACLLLVAATATAGAAAGASGSSVEAGGPAIRPPDRAAVVADAQLAPETDNTVTRIAVLENGSAAWTLQIRTRLSTDGQVEEYRAFQRRFEENTSRYVGSFEESMTGVVAAAGAVTGRTMAATAFRASTSIQTVPRRWGVVTYRFRWTNFAATADGRIVVGDVFEGGLFIAENDSLEIVAPPGYGVEAVDPTPAERAAGVVTWTGREDFADRRPRVVFAPESATGAAGAPLSRPLLVGGAAVLAVAALAVAGAAVRRRRRRGRGSGGTGGGKPADGDEVLLTDEDRVRELLAGRGGRMRQGEIADELDWSKSKTSRVLGRMEEDGAIRKLQLGRENVIDLEADDEA